MKFKIDSENLRKGIFLVEGVISSREIKSQLSNILFEVKKDILTLSATDLEIAIRTSLKCECEEEGEVTLPAKKISLIVKGFEEATIEIASNPSQETIIIDPYGKSHARYAILGLPKTEFPTIPEIKSDGLVSFPNSLLLEMIRKTKYAVAVEDSRYVFNGLYLISSEKNLIVVATDGKRLSKIEREFPLELKLDDGIIVPYKAIREIEHILNPGSSSEMMLVGNQLFIRTDEAELMCNLIEGTYPDYKQVIPEEIGTMIKFSRQSLINSIKKMSTLANEQTRLIKIHFEEEKIKITAYTAELGESDDYIECDYKGEPIEMGFNYNYFLDSLREIEEDELEIGLNEDMTPVVINNKKDEGFIGVVMPMRL
jgi:DNA polymerase-3 subunit beta